MRPGWWRAAALAWALALAAPAPARAIGANSTPVSPEAALTGAAVLAADDPGGGGWYNPAALAAVIRSSVDVGASAYSIATYVIEDAMVSQLPWTTISGDLKDTRYVSVPSVISYTYALRPGLGLSLGVWTPVHDAVAGSTVASSSGPVPGSPALSAAYSAYYSTYMATDETWAGAAVGWQATSSLRLGVALQGLYATSNTSIDLSTSLQTDSTNPSERGGLLQVMVRGDNSVIGTRAMAGLQWDTTPALRLAAAIRSPTMRLWAWGSTTRVTSVATQLPGQPPQLQQYFERVTPGSGLSEIDPVQLLGGLSWRHEQLDLRLEGDWKPALDRRVGGQQATWNLRSGATWRLDEDTLLGFGLFRACNSGIAAQGSFQIVNYGFAAGVDLRPTRVVKALGGGTAWDMHTTLAVRGAYGTGKAPGLLVVPFDPSQSVVPFLPYQDSAYLEVPARVLGGSLSIFTTVSF